MRYVFHNVKVKVKLHNTPKQVIAGTGVSLGTA